MDLMKYRRVIDTYERGSERVAAGTRSLADFQNTLGQQEEARGRYRDQLITSGLKMASDTIEQNEVRAQRAETHRQQTKLNDLKIASEEATAPLTKKKLELDNEKAQLDLTDKKSDMDFETYERDRTKRSSDAAAKAVADTFAAKNPKALPKGWDNMAVEERAAYAAANSNVKKSDLDMRAKEADIASTLQTRDLNEVKTKQAIADLAATQSSTSLATMKESPTALATRGLDFKDQKQKEIYERDTKAFQETQKKIIGIRDADDRRSSIATDLGVTLNADGTLPPEAGNKFAGFKGAVAKMKNDPEYLKVKGKLLGHLHEAAQSRDFGALNRDSEIKMAMQQAGGDPTSSDFNWDLFTDSLFDKGKIQAYFDIQNETIQKKRREVAEEFRGNGGFSFQPHTEVVQSLYDIQPNSARVPGSKDYVDPKDFTGKSADEMYNYAFGAGAVAPSDRFKETLAIDRGLKNGTIQTAAATRMPDYSFSSPKNQQAWDAVRQSRGRDVINANSAEALAGYDPSKPLQPAGGIGQTIIPAKGNPNTPVVLNDTLRVYAPVTTPSLVAAPGATPQGADADDFRRQVMQKGRLHKTWDADTLGVFGVDPAAYNDGGAYAAP